MNWWEGEYGWATKWVAGEIDPKTALRLRIRQAVEASKTYERRHQFTSHIRRP